MWCLRMWCLIIIVLWFSKLKVLILSCCICKGLFHTGLLLVDLQSLSWVLSWGGSVHAWGGKGFDICLGIQGSRCSMQVFMCSHPRLSRSAITRPKLHGLNVQHPFWVMGRNNNRMCVWDAIITGIALPVSIANFLLLLQTVFLYFVCNNNSPPLQ